MQSPKLSNAIARIQELAVYLLIVGTFLLVAVTDGLTWPTIAFCSAIAILRSAGLRLSTNAGCATLLLVSAAAPIYWFFLRSMVFLSIKDFLLAVLMVFLLSAQTGRDFAAVSSYCIWIMMATLFPSSGPQQWILLAVLFLWFLFVQSLNELRRNREQFETWRGVDGWRLLRPLSVFALIMAVGVSAFAGGLYLLLPRNTISSFHINFHPFRRLVGFSGSVRLGEIGQLQDDQSPAFRVRFLDGTPPLMLRWRGVALTDFNGSSWTNTLETWNEFSEQGKITLASNEQRRRPGQRLFYEIQTLAAMDRVLFTLGVPEYIYLPQGRLRRNVDATYRQLTLEDQLPAYSISGWLDRDDHPIISDATQILPANARQRYLRLPGLNPRIRELTEEVVSSSSDAQQSAVMIETFLKTRFQYSLDANISGREPLVDFLFNTRAGHCEYFASAMAVMLRTQKIPSRVITGFYASLPAPIGPWYVIRSSNAHSWVEAWIEGRGWVIYDPTPSNPNQKPLSSSMQWLIQLQDQFIVMSEEWMGGASGLRRPRFEKPEITWQWVMAVSGVIIGLLVWRYIPARKQAPHQATVLYGKYLEITKRQRSANQTAREIETSEITSLYEAARFSDDPQALTRLKQLISREPGK